MVFFSAVEDTWEDPVLVSVEVKVQVDQSQHDLCMLLLDLEYINLIFVNLLLLKR